MIHVLMIGVAMTFLAGGLAGAADSDFLGEFNTKYDLLSSDLLNHEGEYGEVRDFVYRKDVATITFDEGIIHFLRYVDGRPTTAIFVGKGHATVAVPSHIERQSLLAVTGDSTIDEEFETCFMRIGDDFDLAVLEQFQFESKQLSWKNFNLASKKAQGEFFFKPIIEHKFDNYFQLLRSLYERGPDGYFWIDFNRYVFNYDPNRAEQVLISYEHEGGDMTATEVASFGSQAVGIYDDTLMSQIAYPTTLLDRSANVELGGMDGKKLERAQTELLLQINADSLKFVSLFLNDNLPTDSIYYAGQPVDYNRRKDFRFIGLILPEYRYRGDTLHLTLWYHGKQYDHLMPYVENPAVTPHYLEVSAPRGYAYFAPGIGQAEDIDGGLQRFTVSPMMPMERLYFDCYASGLDTLPQVSEVGITVNFLIWELMNKKYSECFIPHELLQPSVMDAFNYMAANFGAPAGIFEVWASPGARYDMPGTMVAPQIACVNQGTVAAMGGVDIIAGRGAAGQWFGPLMRPATDRERWLVEALPEYVTILYLQNKLGSPAYSNLLNRRDTLIALAEVHRDRPLAAGDRGEKSYRANKGLWILHMLRMMMYDVQTGSDQTFMRFVYELGLMTNNRSFTNEDFITLAEKHYGQPLDQFARQWIYGGSYPRFDVEYKISGSGDNYQIAASYEVKNADSKFTMPIITRAVGAGGRSHFYRHTITAPAGSFSIDGIPFEPENMVFNEFYGVLGQDNTSQEK
ncbi:MAG: hypothetical protein ABIE70_05295 [bacterium]